MKLKLYFLKFTRYNDNDKNAGSGVIIPIGRSNPPLYSTEFDVKNAKAGDEAVKKMEEILSVSNIDSGEYMLMARPAGRKFSGFEAWENSRKREFLVPERSTQ